MMLEGDLGKVARSEELLDVIAKYGNRAAEFVWENKAALATGTVLVAFLADPEPFLNGVTKITSVIGETTARPLAEGVARGTNWTVILLVVLGLVTVSALFLAAKYGLFSVTVAAAKAAPWVVTPTAKPDSARTNPGDDGTPSSQPERKS